MLFDRFAESELSEDVRVEEASILVKGSQITLLNLPHFGDSKVNNESILTYLGNRLGQPFDDVQQLTGLVFFQRIRDYREDLSDLSNLRIFQKLCGPNSFQNVLVATNSLDQEQNDLEEARKRALKETPHLWGNLSDGGARFLSMPTHKQDCIDLLLDLADKRVTSLDMRDRAIDVTDSLSETASWTAMKSYENRQIIRDAEELERAVEMNRHKIALQRLDQKVLSNASDQENMFRKLLEQQSQELAALEGVRKSEPQVQVHCEKVRRQRAEVFKQQKVLSAIQERDFRLEREKLYKEHARRLIALDNDKVCRRVTARGKLLMMEEMLLEMYSSKSQRQSFQYLHERFSQLPGRYYHRNFCYYCLDQISLFDHTLGRSLCFLS